MCSNVLVHPNKALEMSNYIESTTEGFVWNINVYKPQGKRAYAIASEGELRVEDNVKSFTYRPFEDRHRRVMLTGNNTAKNRQAALIQLRNEMINAGEIVAGTGFPTL